MSRFLAHYTQYVSKITDAPLEYGEAAGLSILSAISLGRRKLARGAGINPNLFILLMADSSADRKSTSIGSVVELLRDVEEERVGPDDFTPEALLHMMRNKPPQKGVPAQPPRNKMLLPLSEFGLVLAQTGSYSSTMQTTLCKVYDGETFERVRMNGGETRIENPRVTLLAGCAFEMMREYGKESDWSNGFYARCLFITPQTKPPKFRSQPSRSQADYDLVRMQLEDLRKTLSNTPNPAHGGMQLTAGAEADFDAWVMGLPEDPTDIIRTAQKERLINIVLKLALLYQVDEDPTVHVGIDAMRKAIIFASKAWVAFENVLERVAGSARVRLSDRVWKAVAEAGPEGVTARGLQRRTHRKVIELESVLTSLVNMAVIKKVPGPKGSILYQIVEEP